MRSTSEFIDDLKRRGYSVKFDSSVKGKSGVTHQVDLLAEHPEGKKVVGLGLKTCEAGTALDIITSFAVAYDAGASACYATDKELDKECLRLAGSYGIEVLSQPKTTGGVLGRDPPKRRREGKLRGH